MKKFIVVLFLALTQMAFSQDLNSYKYVVVPMEYEFLKEPNQFQLAELTKFLFEKEGFEVYLEGNVPENVSRNNCSVLHADIDEDSGLFVTRLTIELKDCNNNTIFTTAEGTSRQKDYSKAYHEALRNAFESITAQDYEYQEKEDNVVEVSAIPQKQEIEVKGEVVHNIPEPMEQKGEGTTVSLLEEGSENNFVFVRDNAIYYLEKTPSGFNFYQKEMAEPFAALIKSSTGDSYIYSSVISKGVASFNREGDLVVEVLDPGTGTVNAIIYKRQD